MARNVKGTAAGGEPRSVVVLPSRQIDRWHEPPAESRAYEERLLSSLLELGDPDVRMTYVTSLPIDPTTVDYYLSLLPPAVRLDARRRLTLIAVGDSGPRPLSAKLIGRPAALERIRRSLPDPARSHIVPYHVTALERDVALALGVPIYGAGPEHASWGTKTGSRELFALAGIPRPLGAEHIRSVADAVSAVRRLRAADPDLTQLVMKLDAGVSGEGNAIVDIAGLPEPGAPDEWSRIVRRVESLAPEERGVSARTYLTKLAAQGGIIEERITGKELRSPSVQLRITPTGRVELLSTHDQIMGGRSGQHYHGCRFPADPSYAPLIGALARRVAQRLAEMGVMGRLSLDFVVVRQDHRRWEPFAIELNLRMGGTTHPYQALVHLIGGAYDADAATFTSCGDGPRHYVATDRLESPRLRSLGQAGVLALARRGGLRFDRARRAGTVFHMLSAVDELGRVGFTAIGRSAEEADALHDEVHAALSGPAEPQEVAADAITQLG